MPSYRIPACFSDARSISWWPMRTSTTTTTQPPPLLEGDGNLAAWRRLFQWQHLLVVLVIFLASAGMFLSAPKSDDFYWSDAPRHALNGAFVLDFLRTMPIGHPASWAMQYYIQYPALTILFYPPFFYIIEGFFYFLFGVSHASAQLTVISFVFVLGLTGYSFGRLSMGRAAALGLALMLVGAPVIAFWSRQVMLDIPAYALSLIGMLCLAIWLRHDRPIFLYLSALGFVLSVYTKYNNGFLLVPAVITVLFAKGPSVLRDRNVLLSLLASCVLLIPACFLIMRFGDANFGSVAGRPGDLGRFSLAAWLFYARQMPEQLGYVIVILAIAGGALMLARRIPWRMPPWFTVMLLSWFAFGYALFSFIEVREPRHDILVLFPLIYLAASTLDRIGERIPLGGFLTLLVGGGIYAYSAVYAAPPVVTGYRDIATYVAANAPRNGVVLFAGYRDGNFVFAMREHPERQDLTIVRADKLLLTIAVERIRGVTDAGLDESQVLSLLQSLGISMVVAQDDFWQDIPQVARLYHVLDGPAFKRIQSFAITGDLSTNDGRDGNGRGQVEIFTPTYPVTPHEKTMTFDLPIIGHTVTGGIGVH